MKIIDSKTEQHVYNYDDGVEITKSTIELCSVPNQKQFFIFYDLYFKGVVPVPFSHLDNKYEPMSVSCDGQIVLDKNKFSSLVLQISDFYVNNKYVSMRAIITGRAGAIKEILYQQNLCGTFIDN